MLGTRWTDKHEGSTVAELLQACEESALSALTARERLSKHRPEATTALELTGKPLQVYDLQRMETAGIAETFPRPASGRPGRSRTSDSPCWPSTRRRRSCR